MSVEKFLNSDRVYELWAKIKEALAGKQDVITAGDGLSKEDGVLGVDTPVRGIVTRGEFDALPAEQRNKGFYVIPEAGDTSGAYDQVYSTEETRVGTWIDGRPLYRKVVTGVSGERNVWKSIEKIDSAQLVCATGYVDTGGSSGRIVIPNMSSHVAITSSYDVSVYISVDTMVNLPTCVMCIYTKTTDQPEVTG